MLTYVKPDSPESLLGIEDFWLIGYGAPSRISRQRTSGLFKCLLYPMIDGRAASPAELDLHVTSRVDAGMPLGIVPAGGGRADTNARNTHEWKFGETLDATAALIEAGGVQEVLRNFGLVERLCSTRNYKPVLEIVPAFAAELGSLILPQAVAE